MFSPRRGAPALRARRQGGFFLAAILAAAIIAAALLVGMAAPARGHVLPPEECDYELGTDTDADGPHDAGIPSRRRVMIQPFRLARFPCNRPAEFRVAHLTPAALELVRSGVLIDRIPLSGDPGAPVAFERIAEILSFYSWAAEVEPGVFELSASVIQARGTALVMAAPRVREVRLLDEPGVFLGGRGAAAHLEGVSITSWDKGTGGPDRTLEDGRPFVLYQDGSRLNVLRSQLSDLGSDRTSGYGATWGHDATGEVLESTFAHNFFGVYTSHAKDLVFRRNVVRDSLFYGFDPHTGTRGLVVEDNEMYGNGSHGVVGSEDVVDSVFRRNHSHDNAGNGIVMHRRSDRNVIESNRVERNAKDGIVINGSAGNLVSRNVVLGHRVGIRVNEVGPGNRLIDNVIERSHTGIQAYGGASELEIGENRISHMSRTGIMLASSDSLIRGGAIRDAVVGISVRTATQVTGTSILEVENGVVVMGGATAQLENVGVTARLAPVKTHVAGRVSVHGSRPQSLPPPPGEDRGWLPVAGASAISLAVALEVFRRFRSRREPTLAPPGVLNTS